MKALFFGMGSIGTRHLHNLKELRKDIHVDVVKKHHSVSDDVKNDIDHVWVNYDDITENRYDMIFITNPTQSHSEALQKAAGLSKKIFMEKPIFESYQYDLNSFRLRSDGIYYVACPMRFHPVITFLKEYLIDKNVLSVLSICSSYLPNWRRCVDYRTVYSAKSANGGISADLIHEIDYLEYLFGEIDFLRPSEYKVSNLEIEGNDLISYIGRANNTVLEIHLDYFGRQPIRTITLFCQNETIIGDFIKNTISINSNMKQLISSDMYKTEMNYFLTLKDNHKNMNNYEAALKTLKLAQRGR